MKKDLELNLLDPDTGEEKDFRFQVTTEKYNSFLNSMSGSKDKTAPIYNFAVACCHPDDRKEFIELARTDGMETVPQLVTESLLDAYLPKLQVTVKKSNPSPTALSKTD